MFHENKPYWIKLDASEKSLQDCNVQIVMSRLRCPDWDVQIVMSRFWCADFDVQIEMSRLWCPDCDVQIFMSLCRGKTQRSIAYREFCQDFCHRNLINRSPGWREVLCLGIVQRIQLTADAALMRSQFLQDCLRVSFSRTVYLTF